MFFLFRKSHGLNGDELHVSIETVKYVEQIWDYVSLIVR